MRRNKPAKANQETLLYGIFEQHLYQFDDADIDRKTFVLKVVSEYLNYLRTCKLSVPSQHEAEVIAELAAEVNTMLVKKIYGFMSIAQYRGAKRKSRQKGTK